MLLLLSRQVRKQGWDEDSRRELRRPARADAHSVSCLRFVEILFQVGKEQILKKQQPTVDWFSPDCDSDKRKSSGVLCCHAETVPSVCRRLWKVTRGHRQRQSGYSRLVLVLWRRWRLREVTNCSASNRQWLTVNCLLSFFVWCCRNGRFVSPLFQHLQDWVCGFVELLFISTCTI